MHIMTAGRRSKPTVFKVLSGTDQPCRRNDDEPQPDIPDSLQDPPDFLSKTAKAEWYSLGIKLHNAGLLTELDYSAFEKYCIAHGHLVDAETKMGDKFVVCGAKGGDIQNPLMGIINKCTEICHKFLSEFGMTPSSRAKVKVDGAKKKKNKFAENSKKQSNG